VEAKQEGAGQPSDTVLGTHRRWGPTHRGEVGT
jgi:hypothetical protein